MGHVFISYCHEDFDFAQILEEKLRAAQFATWQDVNLKTGDDWRDEIDAAIRGALAVVAVMSPSSNNSRYVGYEWASAFGAGIPVLPVLLKLSYTDLHPRMAAIQGLDFGNYASRPWDALIQRLREIADAERPYTAHAPREAPPVIREAARALDSMNPADRAAAVASLAQMNHPAAVEVLAEAARHPIRDVRFAAANRLAYLGDARALPSLIEAVRWGSRGVEHRDAAAIGQAAVPGLLQALQDMDSRVRSFAMDALGGIGGKAAVNAGIERLHDPDIEMRRSAAWSLGRIGGAAAVLPLREALTDPETRVRELVIDALAKCAGKDAVPDLIPLLQDPDQNIRHRAVCQFEEIGDSRAVPAIVAVLNDPYNQVGAYGAKALQKIGDPQAIPGLIQVLGNKDSTVRSCASTALSSFGVAALAGLRKALDDSNPVVRGNALGLVASMGDDTDLPRLVAAIGDQSRYVRYYAIQSLEDNERARDAAYGLVPALIERLRDQYEDIAAQAAEALRQIRDPRAVPSLIECLQDEGIAESAAGALEAMGTRDAMAAVRAWKQRRKGVGA